MKYRVLVHGPSWPNGQWLNWYSGPDYASARAAEARAAEMRRSFRDTTYTVVEFGYIVVLTDPDRDNYDTRSTFADGIRCRGLDDMETLWATEAEADAVRRQFTLRWPEHTYIARELTPDDLVRANAMGTTPPPAPIASRPVPSDVYEDDDDEEEPVMVRCDDCRADFPEDDLVELNYGSDHVCESCYEDYGTCRNCDMQSRYISGSGYCDDCYEDYEEEGGTEPPQLSLVCPTCSTTNDYFDEVTEQFLCKCGADEARKAGRPVLVPA